MAHPVLPPAPSVPALAACCWPCAAARAQPPHSRSVRAPSPAAQRPPRWPALAMCRWRARRCRPACIGAEALADAGIGRCLSGLTRLDAGVTDAYNAEGYWSTCRARLHARQPLQLPPRRPADQRRDRLPLANKERVEVLKGTSGIQAGTSAPGRPGQPGRQAADNGAAAPRHAGWREGGSVLARSTSASASAPTANSACASTPRIEHLDPLVRNTAASAACWPWPADWRGPGDTLLEAEFEPAASRQPSVPGFSLLGNRVPDAAHRPAHQPEQPGLAQPVVLDGDTASLRWPSAGGGWQFACTA
jgi:iron complex outermembrane receptor protein